MADHPTDKKLAGALKTLLRGIPVGTVRDKFEANWHKIESQAAPAELRQLVSGLWKKLGPLPDKRTEPAREEIEKSVLLLRDNGFVESAGVLFGAWAAVIPLEVAAAARLAPTHASFGTWIKTAKVSKSEIERVLTSDQEQTYQTVGTDWLASNTKSAKIGDLIDKLLAQAPRLPHLRPSRRVLSELLDKDKQGKLLEMILRASDYDEPRQKAVAEAIQHSPVALKICAEALPNLINKEAVAQQAVKLTLAIFIDAVSTQPERRQLFTVALARLVTGILLSNRKTPGAETLLAGASELSTKLRVITRDPQLQTHTWIIENLEQRVQIQKELQITRDGLWHLASAFEKASSGFTAEDVLGTLAENLGLEPIGVVDKVALYDPICHQDTEGGLLPSEPMTVLERGWRNGETVAIRAKVRRAHV